MNGGTKLKTYPSVIMIDMSSEILDFKSSSPGTLTLSTLILSGSCIKTVRKKVRIGQASATHLKIDANCEIRI